MHDNSLTNKLVIQYVNDTSKVISEYHLILYIVVLLFIFIGLFVLILTLNKSIDYRRDSDECSNSRCSHTYCHKLKEHDFKYCMTVLFLVLIFICTLALGDNSRVMEFISFAGTISSLILSVLAIIMTLLAESKNEGTKASIDASLSAIQGTSENLKEYHKYISDVKSKLDTSLENIDIISKNIEQYDSKFEELSSKLDEVNRAVAHLEKILPVVKQVSEKETNTSEVVTNLSADIQKEQEVDFSKMKSNGGNDNEQ